MRFKTILAITSFFLGLPFFAFAQACRSEAGGYCFNLATAAQNTGITASSFAAESTAGDVLESIYIYGLGLVGISALVMLVFGGLKYMTATDNPSQVTSARDTMKNAIFGLVLALLSFLILFTINPDLVRKLELTLEDITVQKTSTKEVCMAAGRIWCDSINSCVDKLEDCIGAGYKTYQWTEVPQKKYCADVLGAGWVNVAPSWCGGNPPTSTSECCARK